MASDDEWGIFQDKCKCGGVIEYWIFGIDCGGNGSSSGIQCINCKKCFSHKELEGNKKVRNR